MLEWCVKVCETSVLECVRVVCRVCRSVLWCVRVCETSVLECVRVVCRVCRSVLWCVRVCENGMLTSGSVCQSVCRRVRSRGAFERCICSDMYLNAFSQDQTVSWKQMQKH